MEWMLTREALVSFLKLAPVPKDARLHERGRTPCDGYDRVACTYLDDVHSEVPCYLFLPAGTGPFPGVVVWHQHNGEWHWGKSEVAGLVGHPSQAFGPRLASRGVVVLAPDVITFEDRRRAGVRGVEASPADWQQHWNEAAYRLIRGDTLMRKILDDAQRAVAALSRHPDVDASRVGTMGHSMGGTIALYLTAIESQVAFCAISGAAASFRARMGSEVGISMFEVVPQLLAAGEVVEVMKLAAPRPIQVMSASNDPYSSDAAAVADEARLAWPEATRASGVCIAKTDGGHELTEPRVRQIVDWVVQTART